MSMQSTLAPRQGGLDQSAAAVWGDLYEVAVKRGCLAFLASEGLLGQNPRLLKNDQNPPELYADLWRTILARASWQGELSNRRKDGSLIDISLTVSPVKDATGRIIGASKIARDITDRRHAEDERDRALARAEQARDTAEVASRAKDELIATVSHELRTPLNSILGYARMLQSGSLDATRASHAVTVIIRSATAQAQLVEDLLELSRIAAGRMALTFEKCELTALVDDALDAVRPAADAKGIALITRLAPDGARVLGAPERLRQVVWNLAMNAIKFTPADGRIDVAVVRADRYAQIVVSDNGIGISPGALAYIFDPFEQEDRSSTRAHGGLGLGLALVKRLVELHGGEVRAESPGKGKGATFTVTIPLATLSSDGDTLQ